VKLYQGLDIEEPHVLSMMWSYDPAARLNIRHMISSFLFHSLSNPSLLG